MIHRTQTNQVVSKNLKTIQFIRIRMLVIYRSDVNSSANNIVIIHTLGSTVVIVAIVVVVAFLALGIVVFLCCWHRRRKRTQIDRGRDEVDGFGSSLKIKGTLGREYQAVPSDELKCSDNKEKLAASLFNQNDLEKVST